MVSLYFICLFLLSVLSKIFIEDYLPKIIFNKDTRNEYLIYFFSFITMSTAILGNKFSEKLSLKFRPYKIDTNSSTFVSKKVISTSSLNCNWGYENSFTEESDYIDLFSCLNKQLITKSNKKIKNIYLIGDSHSTAFAPAAQRFAKEEEFNLIRATHVYCPFRLDYSMNWSVSSPVENFSCRNFNNAIYDYLNENVQSQDIVILASRDLFYYSKNAPISREHKKDYKKGFIKYFDERNKDINMDNVLKKSIVATKKLAEILRNKKSSLLVILQGHENINPLHYCDNVLSTYIKSCTTPMTKVNEYREYAKLIKKLSISQKNLFTYDLLPKTCPDMKCKHLYKGKYIFRDDDHLSNYGAEDFVYEEFKKQFKKKFNLNLATLR